ncbi:MAG TPA: hypothetical protein PLP50_02050 [Thermoanaerobaculia bacterium]|nr:hypothetical protein [Thermoanaerobaculia bacterium]HQN07107.1 hypothetical protein [Thermoanaerobaculia bacterium]HQP84824.1 hypothetical protein [Thermoanaerobaculia bacterium]
MRRRRDDPEQKRLLTREEFQALLSARDTEGLRKMLWELYVRGSEDLRRRIETVALPVGERPKKVAPPPVDGEWHLGEVRQFVALARSGAYTGGTRRVSPSERTRWRLPFRALIDDSGRLLTQGDVANGTEAMSALLDLALDCRDTYYFRTEDPVSALRIVASDLVDLLWRANLEAHGFPALVARAPRDLLRWESPWGWTRMGTRTIAAKERSLADVLAALLPSHDAWVAMAEAWLQVFAATHGGRAAPRSAPNRNLPSQYVPPTPSDWKRWHELLYERLHGSESHHLLERIAAVPERPGVDLWLLRVRLARDAGRAEEARCIARAALGEFPGARELQAIAREVGLR